MAEYIEREAALRVLCDACGNAACPKGLIPQCSYYEKMQSIPAADVRPAKRSEWIGKMTASGMMAVCPDCGKEVRFADVSNFCPNCGADMRKES